MLTAFTVAGGIVVAVLLLRFARRVAAAVFWLLVLAGLVGGVALGLYLIYPPLVVSAGVYAAFCIAARGWVRHAARRDVEAEDRAVRAEVAAEMSRLNLPPR